MINSIKYAFCDKEGMIGLKLVIDGAGYRFIYSDNGKGLNELIDKKGFGSSLIEMSILQLEAHMKIINQDGLIYIMTFKENSDAHTHS